MHKDIIFIIGISLASLQKKALFFRVFRRLLLSKY